MTQRFLVASKCRQLATVVGAFLLLSCDAVGGAANGKSSSGSKDAPNPMQCSLVVDAIKGRNAFVVDVTHRYQGALNLGDPQKSERLPVRVKVFTDPANSIQTPNINSSFYRIQLHGASSVNLCELSDSSVCRTFTNLEDDQHLYISGAHLERLRSYGTSNSDGSLSIDFRRAPTSELPLYRMPMYSLSCNTQVYDLMDIDVVNVYVENGITSQNYGKLEANEFRLAVRNMFVSRGSQYINTLFRFDRRESFTLGVIGQGRCRLTELDGSPLASQQRTLTDLKEILLGWDINQTKNGCTPK